MSEMKERVQDLLNRLNRDSALRKEVLSLDDEGFFRLLQENGVKKVTPDQAAQILAQIKAAGSDGELSEEELSKVAGGIILRIVG